MSIFSGKVLNCQYHCENRYIEIDINKSQRQSQKDGEMGREMNEVTYPPAVGIDRFGLLVHKHLCRLAKTNYILQ